jgi:hypothetical protein
MESFSNQPILFQSTKFEPFVYYDFIRLKKNDGLVKLAPVFASSNEHDFLYFCRFIGKGKETICNF